MGSALRCVVVLLFGIVGLVSCTAAWKPASRGMTVAIGRTTLGAGTDVTCEVKPGHDLPLLRIIVTPACTTLSPIRVEMELRSSRSDEFNIHYSTPVDKSLEAHGETPIELPLTMYPAEGSQVWAQVSATCDNRKSSIEGAALCHCER